MLLSTVPTVVTTILSLDGNFVKHMETFATYVVNVHTFRLHVTTTNKNNITQAGNIKITANNINIKNGNKNSRHVTNDQQQCDHEN